MFIASNSKFSRFLRSVDRFSMPFQFCIEDNHKKKQTEVGGGLSVLIYSISLSYLIYLTKIFLDGGIQPSISVTTLSSTENKPYKIDETVFGIGFFIDSYKSIIDLEIETSKKYLLFQTTYNYYDEKGNLVRDSLQMKPCDVEGDLSGYYCFDFSIYQGRKLNLVQISKSIGSAFEGLSILIYKCEGQAYCAESSEIDKVLFNIYNRLKIAISFSRYNAIDYKQEQYYQIESQGLDPIMGQARYFSLVQSQVSLLNGFILQNNSSSYNLDSAYQSTEVRSVQGLKEQKGISILAMVVFKLSQDTKHITIQYPLFTQMLAQFMSVFSILLILGQSGIQLSELKIHQSLSNLLLQVYYKKSAIKFVKAFEVKQLIKAKTLQPKYRLKTNEAINKDQFKVEDKDNLQDINFKLGDDRSKLDFDDKSSVSSESQDILEKYNLINKTYFPNILSKTVKFNIFKKIQILIKKMVPNSVFNENKELKNVIKVIDNAKKYLNIKDFFQEFMKIKIMVGLLLTKEQYAAIQFCGLDITKVEELLEIKEKKNYTRSQTEMFQPLLQDQIIQRKQTIQIGEKQPDQNTANNIQSLQQQKLQQLQQSANNIEVQYKLYQQSSASQQMPTNRLEQEQLYQQQQNIRISMAQINQEQREEQSRINHLEVLESIDKDETYLNLYLERFITQVRSNYQEGNTLNQRIYQCFLSKYDQSDNPEVNKTQP